MNGEAFRALLHQTERFHLIVMREARLAARRSCGRCVAAGREEAVAWGCAVRALHLTTRTRPHVRTGHRESPGRPEAHHDPVSQSLVTPLLVPTTIGQEIPVCIEGPKFHAAVCESALPAIFLTQSIAPGMSIGSNAITY